MTTLYQHYFPTRRSSDLSRRSNERARRRIRLDEELTYEPSMTSEDLAQPEHVPATITQKTLTADLLRLISTPGPGWWTIFIVDLDRKSTRLNSSHDQISY